MISRRTARVIAEGYTVQFTGRERTKYGFRDVIYQESLYDFLYDRDYAPWFCNCIKAIRSTRREFQEFFMKLHTGESQVVATKNWNWEQRERLGQDYLSNLGRDFLNFEV